VTPALRLVRPRRVPSPPAPPRDRPNCALCQELSSENVALRQQVRELSNERVAEMNRADRLDALVRRLRIVFAPLLATYPTAFEKLRARKALGREWLL
jgi:hypothetical protein